MTLIINRFPIYEHYLFLICDISPLDLVEDLLGAVYGLPGEPVQPGEHAVPGLAGEVPGAHYAPVILPDGLVQEHARPLPGPELGLPDELDAAGLDAVHVHVHADDEGVGI